MVDGLEIATHPLHNDKPERVGVGPGLAFARRLLERQPTVADQILLVPTAVGGSRLDQWAADGELFKAATSKLARAIELAEKAQWSEEPQPGLEATPAAANGSGVFVAGILWHQGESDADDEALARTYEQRLAETIGCLRVAATRAVPLANSADCASDGDGVVT
jgi:hypothetical protein